MTDIEIKIFIQKVKKNQSIWYLILPFIFKLGFDTFKKKFLKKSHAKFIIPNFIPISKYEFNPIVFIKPYSPQTKRPNLHFEGKTEIDQADDQYAHYQERFYDILFINEEQLEITVSLLDKWIINNPVSNTIAWHPYNVSERIVNWSVFITRFNSLLNENQKQSILQSLYFQSEFLYNNFEHHLGHHNHLINNSRALLFACTLFKDEPFTVNWKTKALVVIDSEMSYQVLLDGAHAEQSAVYHLLLTRSLWEIKEFYAILDQPFNYDITLKKMVIYSKWLIRSNNTIPFLGHITPDIHWKELVGLASLWIKNTKINASFYSTLFNSNYCIDENNGSHPETVKIFPKSGLGIIKVNGIEIFLSNDPRCEIMCHGDQNQLGIDITWNNTVIVHDAGLDSYNLDSNRKWFESWQGQSTCVINNTNPIVSNWRRKQLPFKYYKATANLEKSTIYGINATHNCFNRLLNASKISRDIAIIDDKIQIRDIVTCNEISNYNALFNLGSNKVILKNNEILICDFELGNNFRFCFPQSLKVELKKYPIAKAYGVKTIGNSLFLYSDKNNYEKEFNFFIEKQ